MSDQNNQPIRLGDFLNSPKFNTQKKIEKPQVKGRGNASKSVLSEEERRKVREELSRLASKSPAALGQLSDPDTSVDSNKEADCSKCGNKRFIVNEETGALHPCPACGVAQRWRVESIKAYSSYSKLSAQQTFFTFKTDFNDERDDNLLDSLGAAEEFAAQPDARWLVLWGERGSGKSHLCAATDNHLRASGIPSVFITAPELMSSLKEALDFQQNTDRETYTGRLDIFKKAIVLILDDLGAESRTIWSNGVLFEILDYRYRNRLPTMIATNVPPDQFDPRIASRMQDTSLSMVIENAAPDFRRRPTSEK